MAIGITVFEVMGKTPLLMNNPASMLVAKPDMKIAKEQPTPEADCEAKVFRHDFGRGLQLYLPSTCFRNTIIYACVGQKVGKLSAAKAVQASVSMPESRIPLWHVDAAKKKFARPVTEYAIDIQRAVIGTASIPRARPRVDDWCCKVPIEIDSDYMKPELILRLFQLAGRMSGLGDYRRSCGGDFGAFTAEILG